MSYGEYKFGDFAKLYDVGGPSDELVGFAQGFAQGFVPAYQAGIKAEREKDLALAKLDKAAELDAQKAKNDANTAYKENMDKAKQIHSHGPGPAQEISRPISGFDLVDFSRDLSLSQFPCVFHSKNICFV